MRKLAFAAIFLLTLAFNASASYYIQSFHADLSLSASGTLDVVETLTVVYMTPHHGIERWIPVSYPTPVGTSLTIDLTTGPVTMDGATVPVSSYRSGRNRVLRIGDPDVTITGPHVYRIEYAASRAILFHDTYLQLYWNVTGTDWDVPIQQATATLTLPSTVTPDLVSATSYAGAWGSSARGMPVALDAAGRFTFSTGALNPGSGLTIDVSIPRTVLPIKPPTFAQNLARFLWDNKLALLPLATLVLMVILWSRYGRDPRTGTIAPAFEPPDGIGPGQAGVLIDDRMDLRDISAMVIGLAVSGHLSIREDSPESGSLAGKALSWVAGAGTHYTFVRSRSSPDTLSPAERALFDAIFPDAETKETTLSSLENQFYKHLPTIRIRLYDELIKKRYYVRNPERVRQSYAGWAGALIAAGAGLGFVFSSVYVGVALGLSGLVVLAFSPIMPRKTQTGTEAFAEVLGLAEYIHRAEKERIEFTDAPEKKPEHFEKLLPYAVAFGLTAIWVRTFAGLLHEPPTWYVGAGPSFNPALFALSMSHLSNGMQSAFVSAPRTAPSGRSAWGGHSSFGGGFSGGGFGGGGGRGW